MLNMSYEDFRFICSRIRSTAVESKSWYDGAAYTDAAGNTYRFCDDGYNEYLTHSGTSWVAETRYGLNGLEHHVKKV